MDLRNEWKWIVLLILACALVFSSAAGGEFVYDDVRQIMRNPLIQDNALIWQALTSDVWAAKGGGGVAASNYWRPTLSAWEIVNFRLFGINPLGWHLANIFLHAGICVLAYGLLRRWSFSALIAFSIALVFAVHPVHVESVAWIMGVADLLFTLSFLGSLWFATSFRDSGSYPHLALMLVMYAIALGSKEIGVFCMPIYYFVLTLDGPAKAGTKRIAIALAATFAAAVGYFIIRWYILGFISRPSDDPVTLGAALMSVPMMFVFYLRQAFFPYWIAFNYPLRPIGHADLLNFILPALISLCVIAALFYIGRRSGPARLGAAIFLLPLIPAMNATAFPAEQLVHDRYLYLPLLGLLIVAAVFALTRLSERQVAAAAIVLCIPLSIQTFLYSRDVRSELSLWRRTAQIDDSSFVSIQYGSALSEAGLSEEAIAVYSASIAKKPTPRAYLGRAMNRIKLKNYAEAEEDLKKVISSTGESIEPYALYQTYKMLGIAYAEQQKHEDAARLFRAARRELPMYAAALTVDLATVLYQAGKKENALQELERAAPRARQEMLPESKDVFFKLGMLYAEAGMNDQARAALNAYLEFTRAFGDKYTQESRIQAEAMLEQLK